MDVATAVKAAKGGEVQFKVEKAGVIHAGVGKASFGADALAQNVRAFIDAVRARNRRAQKAPIEESLDFFDDGPASHWICRRLLRLRGSRISEKAGKFPPFFVFGWPVLILVNALDHTQSTLGGPAWGTSFSASPRFRMRYAEGGRRDGALFGIVLRNLTRPACGQMDGNGLADLGRRSGAALFKRKALTCHPSNRTLMAGRSHAVSRRCRCCRDLGPPRSGAGLPTVFYRICRRREGGGDHLGRDMGGHA